MRTIFIVISSILLLFTVACGNSTTSHREETGDTVKLKYSELLTIVKYRNYTIVNVTDPWHKENVLQKYILVPSQQPADHLPKGTIIQVPLKRSIPFTSVHSSLIISLGKEESIAGVADLRYMKLPYIQKNCAEGKIIDVGDAMMPDIERIIDTNPDAILISPFDNNGGYGKIEELHIPLIECADYMETSPLARAEWMKFYGMLYGAEASADSLFALVDSSYNALKTLAQKSNSQHSVIMDKKTGSVWYVPAGHSTIGRMLADANTLYPFADNSNSGSLAMPFETVLERAGESDIWLFRYNSKEPITYNRLLSEYHGYSELKAFRNRKCYGCNVETSLFYEESPFRPDYHLNDIISITHPEITGLDSLRYYHKL